MSRCLLGFFLREGNEPELTLHPVDASHPAAGSAEKRANFKADPMLAVGLGDMSSYATEKRGNFKADPMLAVGVGDASSYATEKRGNFKADPMLAVGVGEASSYAS